MKYNENVKCDVCGQDILLPAGRIEWNFSNSGQMQICHHDCSHGMKNDTIRLSDMILDQGLSSDFVYERLRQIPSDYGKEYYDECRRIQELLFGTGGQVYCPK